MITYPDYTNLPSFVKNQLTSISKLYKNNNDVLKLHNKINNKATGDKSIETDLFNHTIMTKFTTKYLLEYHYDALECYSNDKKIKLTKLIKPDKAANKTSKHAVVLEGIYEGNPIIVKHYEPDDIDITYEIDIYNKLRNIGCKIPIFNDQFMVLDKRVLALEKLEKLDKNDNIYKIGMHVVSQLSYLHTFAIHNDIKPDNIMKKIIDEKPYYYLIDYGGVATSKLCCGYKRRIWSPKWTCQERGMHNQVTHPKHDFIELGYTLNFIHKGFDNNSFKNICKTHLGKYDEFVKSLGKHNDKHYNKAIDYKMVINIFKSYLK
jgi:hypothetical protein